MRINKEIIEDFYKNNNLNFSSNSENENFYIKKLKEESKILAEQLDKVLIERDEIRNKVSLFNFIFQNININKIAKLHRTNSF